ncbi:tripartite tricarboxylate transporter substrate-binding protein [Rhizobium pusense]|nr:tripartite tricarboxylate transporter substrate-binding protein [Agrobacterium pusense]MDH0118138.1 tripartite tricarboxylate transporter substrate-binding protein [Agrobacterium pusense]
MLNIETMRAVRRRGALLAMAAAVVIAGGVAHAAEWVPQKPIRLVVPYGPGGSSDIIARVMASEMSKGLGQQIVVENKPGASGVVAMQDVARSDPDGYTIVLGHVGTLAVNPSMLPAYPMTLTRTLCRSP